VDKFLTFSITGLATAAIFAVGASGLVLTYTTTGIFNFAHGAVGMLGAFAYWQMRFDWGWPAPVALVIVLLVLAPLFGALLEVTVMRNLQGTSEATKLVVTISLLAGLIGLANWIWAPGVNRPANSFFQGRTFSIANIPVTWHEATALVAAILVAVGLRFILYGTRAGIAMRASVDDRPLATLNGARPDRSAMLAWAIGSSLAALSGIFFLGSLGLDAGVLSLLIVNAYAAALIGRLRSLPMTFLGAVILGLADAYAHAYLPDNQYLTSLPAALPVIILFVVLLVLPVSRLRGHGAQRTREFFPMPTMRGTLMFAAVLVAGSAFIMGMLTRANTIDAAQVFALGIIALSLVPLVGFAGQVSLCQLSLAGIGAIVMAHLGTGGNVVGLVAAVVAAAIVGALIALPALRLSGIYLALATAAFAVALDRWIFSLPKFTVLGHDVAIFGTGSLGVDRLSIFGYQFESEQAQLLLLATVFGLVAIFVVWMRRGPFGRRLLAMKDSEAACATVGMNLTGTKLAVFAVSAGIAGLGGALYGGLNQSINAQNFDFVTGLPIFMMTVVGGIGAVGGAFFAGVALSVFSFAAEIVPALSNVLLVTPGAIGVGLGRNPSGAIKDMRESFDPLRRSRPALAGFAVVLVAMRGAVAVDVMSNWAFVIGSFVALVVALLVAERLLHEAPAGGRLERRAADEPEGTLEWLGVDRPFTPDDVRALDARLALNEIPVHGAP